MATRGGLEGVPAPLLILGGITSVQFGSAFADHIFDQAGPAGTTLMRLLFSAAVLLGLSRPRLAGRSRRELLAVAGFGLTLGCMNWVFYEALQRLPLGVAVTVEFAGPLALAVAGSRRLLDLLWAVLAGAGVLLLAVGGGGGHSLDALGLLLALLAGGFWALYILLSQRVGSTFSGLQGLAVALGVGTLVVLPAGIAEGGSALLQPSVLGVGIAVAMLSSLVPFSLEITALRRIRAATFGLLMSLEPAVAALAGLLVLGQHPHPTTLLALLLVISASVGVTVRPGRPSNPPPLG